MVLIGANYLTGQECLQLSQSLTMGLIGTNKAEKVKIAAIKIVNKYRAN